VDTIRILLIDDNPDDRSLAARELRLRFTGCSLKSVGTADELDSALAADGYDLVITDYHLPWTDGIRILRKVRKKYPEIPVIIFTGTGNEKIAAQALKEGADDYVIKTAGRLPQLIIAAQLALDRSAERQAALEARVRFHRFAETLPIGWFVIAYGGVLLDANPQMSEMLGYPDRASLMSSPMPNFFESPEAQTEFHRRLSADRKLDGYELRLRRKDNTFVWARFFAHPIVTAEGQPAFEALVENIQARKDADRNRQEKEEELQRLNERLRVVLDAAPSAIIGVNIQGNIDFVWNRAAERLLGKSREEAFGAPIFSLIPEMAPLRDRVLSYLDRAEGMSGRQVTFHRGDGRDFQLTVHAAPLTAADGSPLGAIGVLLDVTEQTMAQERLRASESRLSLVYEYVSDYLVLLGMDGGKLRVVIANRAVAEVLQHPVEEIIRRPLTDFFSRAVVAEMTRICRRIFRSRKPHTFVSSTRLLNGRRESTENTLTPILDADGRCSSILLVAHNIHTRQALHALRESERRYRALAEAAHDMIFILDRELRITYVNSFASQNLSSASVQLIGRFMPDLFPPEIATRQANTIHMVLATGEPAYREAPSRVQGRAAWLGTWLIPLRNSQGIIEEILGVSRDITERVQAEQSLRDSEEKYRSLVHTSPDAIFLHDLNGTITFSNQRALDILGYDASEELNSRRSAPWRKAIWRPCARPAPSGMPSTSSGAATERPSRWK
jgi:PAS domain S-box-containing protein